MDYNDIACDCETLGKRFDAPVIAIGARAFNRSTGKLGAKFYMEIDLDSAIKCGRVDGATLAWWVAQSDRAKQLFDQAKQKDKPSMATALVEFSHWAIGQGKGSNDQSGPVQPWGNGATADITWLEHAYTVGGHGLAIPWDFRKIRDLRTIVEAAEDLHPAWSSNDVARVGTHHNAVDDATYQANVISAAWGALRQLREMSMTSLKADKVQKQLAARKPATNDEDDEL